MTFKIALFQAVVMFFEFSKSVLNEAMRWSNFHRSIKGKENRIISNAFRNGLISNVFLHHRQCLTKFPLFAISNCFLTVRNPFEKEHKSGPIVTNDIDYGLG